MQKTEQQSITEVEQNFINLLLQKTEQQSHRIEKTFNIGFVKRFKVLPSDIVTMNSKAIKPNTINVFYGNEAITEQLKAYGIDYNKLKATIEQQEEKIKLLLKQKFSNAVKKQLFHN